MGIRLSPILWKRLALAYFLMTTILLLWSGNALPKTNLITIPFFDKIIHLILFALLSALFLKAYPSSQKYWKAKILVCIILYGILIEFVQLYLVPFRSFEIVDILADSLGALSGLILVRRLTKYSI